MSPVEHVQSFHMELLKDQWKFPDPGSAHWEENKNKGLEYTDWSAASNNNNIIVNVDKHPDDLECLFHVQSLTFQLIVRPAGSRGASMV